MTRPRTTTRPPRRAPVARAVVGGLILEPRHPSLLEYSPLRAGIIRAVNARGWTTSADAADGTPLPLTGRGIGYLLRPDQLAVSVPDALALLERTPGALDSASAARACLTTVRAYPLETATTPTTRTED